MGPLRPGRRSVVRLLRQRDAGKCRDTGSRSAMARSFERDKNFAKLKTPTPGCIVTFWRRVKSKGFGHVGFYAGDDGQYTRTLGGNESDMVQVEQMRKAGSTFGLSGFHWPASAPLLMVGSTGPLLALGSTSIGKAVSYIFLLLLL